MNLELRKFNMSEIKDDKVVVLIGKRDTGKSYLCKDILSHHTGIPAGQVVSGTEAANSFYGKINSRNGCILRKQKLSGEKGRKNRRFVIFFCFFYFFLIFFQNDLFFLPFSPLNFCFLNIHFLILFLFFTLFY